MANALIHILSLLSLMYVAPPVTALSNNLFSAELSALVVNNKAAENVVYSPFSMHSSLALLLMGAADHTESEIRNALNLGDEPKEDVAIEYASFLNNTLQNQNDGQELLISNGLFVGDKIKISKSFSDLASYNFKSQLENINFSQAEMASKRINDWISQQTKDNIRDFIQPQSLSGNEGAVLLNAIYFKGNWKYAFKANKTKKRDFFIRPTKKVPVDTMVIKQYFRYAELPMLKVKAIELPYKNSDISMLIILPEDIIGLKELEKNLKGMNLNEITSQMILQKMIVYLPKFHIETEIDLKEPLRKMGLSSLFQNANFSNMFDNAPLQEISDVKQKTIITCNEEGAKAASVTASRITNKSFPPRTPYFKADHPFVFIIRSETMVFFYGHVAKF